MTVEPLNIDDYDALLALWDHTGLPYEKEDRDSRASIERQIFDDNIIILTLKHEGRLIGSSIGSSDGRKGWINRVAVEPEFRGKRLAARLIEKTEAFLAGKGVRVIGALIEDQNFPSMSAFRHCDYEGWDKIVYFRKKLK
ncbi:MAG: GNAT family N-acetyltransferase [FCB group bacterium]|nr:GNAT family N-acetyltransferase [FCB group bacterium]